MRIFNFQFSVPRHELSLCADQRGYSLVEVLVAISVLLIALVGPLTIAHSGLKRSYLSREYTTATFLAQEGIEAIVRLRENKALSATTYDNLTQLWWESSDPLRALCPSSGSLVCGVTISETGGAVSIYRCNVNTCRFTYTAGAQVPYKQQTGVVGTEQFSRQLKLDFTNDEYIRVRSTVSWTGSNAGSVTLESYVYNTYYAP